MNGPSDARSMSRCSRARPSCSWGSTTSVALPRPARARDDPTIAAARRAPSGRRGPTERGARSDGAGVTFTIEADRFLHRMVRFLGGAMVDVALGRRPLDDLPRLLTATDNQAASPPAPPQGLYLVAVRYPADFYAEAPSL